VTDATAAARRDRRILDVVRALHPGEVTTYGDVADVAGSPGRARLVGHLLATGADVPWWRVVDAAGRLRAVDAADQAARLRAEGVVVVDGRVRDAPLGRFRVRSDS
jgi:methylated-DNA-protein-cysteine methyltransferase-like protein